MGARTRWIVVAVVVVLLAGGLLVWRWTGSASGCDIPATVQPGPESGPAGLQVEQQGFTWLPAGFRGHSASIGAVLANSSDRTAYRTRVRFRLLDANGHELAVGESANTPVREIPVIQPGGRVGVGNELIPDVGLLVDPHTGKAVTPAYGATGPVASVQIVVLSTHWLSRDALGADFRPETAETPTFVPAVPQRTAYNTVRFREHAPSCAALAGRGKVVVFRDANGGIVGGTTWRDVGSVNPPRPCAEGDQELQTDGEIPAHAVAARSEVYPYCDLPGAA